MGTLKTLKPLEILFKLPNPGIKEGGEPVKHWKWPELEHLQVKSVEEQVNFPKNWEGINPSYSNGPELKVYIFVASKIHIEIKRKIFFLMKNFYIFQN